jgi:hypothetical protein
MTEKGKGTKVPTMKVVKEEDVCAKHDVETAKEVAKEEETDIEKPNKVDPRFAQGAQAGNGEVKEGKKIIPQAEDGQAYVNPSVIVKEEFDAFTEKLNKRLGRETGYFVLVDIAGIGSFIGGNAPANISIGILEMAKFNIMSGATPIKQS